MIRSMALMASLLTAVAVGSCEAQPSYDAPSAANATASPTASRIRHSLDERGDMFISEYGFTLAELDGLMLDMGAERQWALSDAGLTIGQFVLPRDDGPGTTDMLVWFINLQPGMVQVNSVMIDGRTLGDQEIRDTFNAMGDALGAADE